MTDDPPDPAYRQATAAYRSAGKLRQPSPAPQVVRVVDPPASAAAPSLPQEPAPEASDPLFATAPAASPAKGVSLMITSAQKDGLRKLGVSEAEIRDMTPAEAHRRLGLTGR